MFLPERRWCWTGLAGGLYLAPLCPWINLKAAQQLGTMGGKVQGRSGFPSLPPFFSFHAVLDFKPLVDIYFSFFVFHMVPTHFHIQTQLVFSLALRNVTTALRREEESVVCFGPSICSAIWIRDRGGWDQETVGRWEWWAKISWNTPRSPDKPRSKGF